MAYTKRLVCLANSRKHSGRCVAGLELQGAEIGNWIRPVSARASEELSIEERRYEDGSDVQLLDTIEVVFSHPRPHACQVENHVIDDTQWWRQVGRFPAPDLRRLAVTTGPLWVDGHRSYSGVNDRIPLTESEGLPSSLILALPQELRIDVLRGLQKRQVRAVFRLGSSRYSLTVTDPKLEARYLAMPDGTYPYTNTVVVCISLGEPFDGYRYKLIASIIDV